MATVNELSGTRGQNLQVRDLSRYFLFVCFWAVFFYFFLLLKPFFSIIIFSAVFAIALMPIHRRVLLLFRYPSLSAAISCVLFTFGIVLPFIALIFVLKDEMLSLYSSIQAWLQPGVLSATFQWLPGHSFYDTYQYLLISIPIQPVDMTEQIITFMREIVNFLLRESQMIIAESLRFFVGFLMMFFLLFYFFRDGLAIVSRITHLSLLPQYQEEILVHKIRSLMSVIFYGVILSALVQGLIGMIGFSIAGIGKPLLLGIFVAFLSPIPYVGTALVWVPAVVLLYLAGDFWQAIFLAIWCTTIMSSVDAFLKPLFIGRQANVHSLLMFVCLFGGMAVYGPLGLVIGPLVALLVVTFSEMYLASKPFM